jgi:hypothetical protein
MAGQDGKKADIVMAEPQVDMAAPQPEALGKRPCHVSHSDSTKRARLHTCRSCIDAGRHPGKVWKCGQCGEESRKDASRTWGEIPFPLCLSCNAVQIFDICPRCVADAFVKIEAEIKAKEECAIALPPSCGSPECAMTG